MSRPYEPLEWKMKGRVSSKEAMTAFLDTAKTMVNRASYNNFQFLIKIFEIPDSVSQALVQVRKQCTQE